MRLVDNILTHTGYLTVKGAGYLIVKGAGLSDSLFLIFSLSFYDIFAKMHAMAVVYMGVV